MRPAADAQGCTTFIGPRYGNERHVFASFEQLRQVEDRFVDARLHERDVLESGGVEDDVGAVKFENLFESGLVADVGQDGRARRREFAVDSIEGLLGRFEEEQMRRIVCGDRMRESRSDGTSCTRDEDVLACDQVAGDCDGFR